LIKSLGLAIAAAIAGGFTPSAKALSPQDVLERIDQNYPKLRSARLEIESARAKLQEKRGAFDPVFSIDNSFLRYNASSNRGKTYTTQMSEGAVEMTMPNGMKVFAGSRLNLGNVKSPTSATGDLGEYFVGVKMPLLRGAGINDKSIAERQARIGVGIAEAGVAATRLDTLLGGGQSYWEWAAAQRRLQIAEDLLRISRERAANIRTRVQRGDLPRIDSIEADTEVKRREGNLAKAERDVQKASLKLALYLWDGDGQPVGLTAPAPTDLGRPEPISPERIREASDRAVTVRPELRTFDLARDVTQLTLDLARNDRRPSLDLVISPGMDMGASSIGPTVKAGIFYSIPLRQNTADGRINDAQQKLAKLALDRQLTTQQISTEVADAASAVNQAHERYVAAEAELELARSLEEGERRRFQLGEGTLFLLNQRERATAEAAARLVDVIAEYQQAILAFRAASADL